MCIRDRSRAMPSSMPSSTSRSAASSRHRAPDHRETGPSRIVPRGSRGHRGACLFPERPTTGTDLCERTSTTFGLCAHTNRPRHGGRCRHREGDAHQSNTRTTRAARIHARRRPPSPHPSAWQPSECCLLYTSPSPRDRTRSRMPSSA